MKPSILNTLSAVALSGALLAGCGRGDREQTETSERADTSSMGMPGDQGTGVGGTVDTGFTTERTDTQGLGTETGREPGAGGTRTDTSGMTTDTGLGTGAFDTSRSGTGGAGTTPRDTAGLDTMDRDLPGIPGSGPGSGFPGGGY